MRKELLCALLRPSTYGEGVKEVKLLQTHTSWVFLTGRYAYKIKKPVNFGFLNYTTLQRRKHFCEEELRLNRLLSKDIYLDVVPITLHKGEVRIKGRGKIVEYAVKMKELPQSSIMTNLLKEKRIDSSIIDKIASQVARFHQTAETSLEIEKYGRVETVEFNWEENFEQTKNLRGDLIEEKTFDEIKERVERFIRDRQFLFLERIEKGKVRRCHGDLHSGNIFIVDGKVYIFDCIEFNLRFSCSDTTSDIAFFVMDMEFLGEKPLSDFFLDRYILYSQDPGILRLLDFYKCYRAYVRGKVTSFKLFDKGISDEEKEEARDIAKRYFHLAHLYTRNFFKKPRLIVVMGLPGVGKSYLAERLARKINAHHLRTDFIRKELAGVRLEEFKGTGFEKGIYSTQMSKKTYNELFRRTEEYLLQGKTCILDATFQKDSGRNRAVDLARRLDIEPLFIHCICPEGVVLKRMEKRLKEISASDATPRVYYKMREVFKPPSRRLPNLVRIDTSEDIEKVIEELIKKERL